MNVLIFLASLFVAYTVQVQGAKILPTASVHKGCVENGKHYMPGESFHPSPCQYCHCGDDGRVFCAVMDCAYPACADAVRAPDQCCPVCPNGRNCRAPDGTIIAHGKQVTMATGAVCTCPDHSWHDDAICYIADPFPAMTVNSPVAVK